MRKTACVLFSILILACSIVGCSNSEVLSIGSYVFEESIDVIKPTVSLEENNKFSFTYSALSSYLPSGTYKIDNNRLILNTEDTIGNIKIEYVFEINNGTLVFNAEQSTKIPPSLANVPDGAVFK